MKPWRKQRDQVQSVHFYPSDIYNYLKVCDFF